MAGALTLIIFVASGEADDASSRSMLRATRSALGNQSHVELREARDPANDGQALAAEQGARADAVVELTWAEAGHRQARLRVHLARSDRWVDRSIGFQASDVDAERGRTIGFAVASMIPESSGGAGPEPEPPAPPPPLAPPEAPSTSAPAGVAPLAPTVALPAPGAERAVSLPTRRVTATTPRASDVVAIDVVALGAAGGDVEVLGAAASVQWFLVPALSLRLGGGARAGNVQAAEASTLTLLGQAGAVVYPLRTASSRPFGLWVRADYVVEHLSLTHFSADEPSPVTMERWLSGMDALVGVDWRFTPEVGLVLGAGGEDVFSTTYVQVRGVTVATLPPLRGVAEAGFRLAF